MTVIIKTALEGVEVGFVLPPDMMQPCVSALRLNMSETAWEGRIAFQHLLAHGPVKELHQFTAHDPQHPPSEAGSF